MSDAEPAVLDRRRRRRVTDERMLDAALDEFAVHGFVGASVQAIADRARTTKATLYANLGDKDRLYAAVVAREATNLRERLLGTYAEVSGRSVPDQLRAGIGAIFSFATERPAAFRLLLGGVADSTQTDPILRQVYDEVVDGVSTMVAPRLERVGASDPKATRLLSAMLVGMFRAAATAAVLDADMNPAAAAEAAHAVATRALRGLDGAMFEGL